MVGGWGMRSLYEVHHGIHPCPRDPPGAIASCSNAVELFALQAQSTARSYIAQSKRKFRVKFLYLKFLNFSKNLTRPRRCATTFGPKPTRPRRDVRRHEATAMQGARSREIGDLHQINSFHSIHRRQELLHTALSRQRKAVKKITPSKKFFLDRGHGACRTHT